MMLKRSLALSFGLLFLGFTAFGNVWYSENFDDFKDGDIAGQDDWKTAMNQKTCQIGSEVKRGDTGKSILVTEQTMVSRNFDGTHDGVQYVSLFTQRDKGAGTMLFYIGGDAIKWGGAAVFNTLGDTSIHALDGNAGQQVGEIKLGEWHHFRAGKPQAVSASDKLATTWVRIKR